MELTEEIQDALVQYALSFLKANIDEEECEYIRLSSVHLEDCSEEQIEKLLELTQQNH
tara:strand:- start:2615 stop:2788 length:174 start_codon:yes stop_codon:yes gene_type:complete